MTSNKNKHGGKGYKKGKKSTGERKLIFAETDQLYAKVVKLLGDQRILCVLHDEFESETKKNIIEYMAHIRGSMRKKVWVNINDIILVSKRDFGDKTFDVIHKYEYDEVKQLYKLGKLKNINFITEKKYSENSFNHDGTKYEFDFDSDNEEKEEDVKLEEESEEEYFKMEDSDIDDI